MVFYVVVGVLSLGVFPLSYRRSGSMTRYVTGTGAPLVWVLVGFAALTAALAEAFGGDGTSQAVFTGGLIGTAFAQVILMRRTARIARDAESPEQPLEDSNGRSR